MVRVCLLIHGSPEYFHAGRQAALSVLERSDFNLFLAIGKGPDLGLPTDPRIVSVTLPESPVRHRSARFLKTLAALRACIDTCSDEYVMCLDADAIFATDITVSELQSALQSHALGMVEQITIRGSGMSRTDFLKHYRDYSLKFIAPDEVPPPVEQFRFFNAGVILGTRSEFDRITAWALNAIAAAKTEHQIGEHMITDQDYFQYWTNNLNPGCCISLPWCWNHCEHWDEGFPRSGARVLHFSNFCNGPSLKTIRRMEELRKSGPHTIRATSVSVRLKQLLIGRHRVTPAGGVRRLWLDLGELGMFVSSGGPLERWQDHGMGLLRTILRDNGIQTDMFSFRSLRSWRELPKRLTGYDQLIMNVRSYTFPFASQAAEVFKRVNPDGIVITGGMHATVAPDEMSQISSFDRICNGPGERVIVDLLKDPQSFPRVIVATGSPSMAEWPMIDRTLWPNPKLPGYPWPLEPECGWGPGPVATIITSRVCPWQCSFCNEASFIPNMRRKPVDLVIEELNFLDRKFGPLGSVVIHDSMFFQQPVWLHEWLDKYPRLSRKPWPYWAAARADTVRRWPDLFEALVRETNWSTVSIGFESGSTRVLELLNKECTADDNEFAIDLLNRIGQQFEREGKEPPKFWANIMLGIPGEGREDAFATMRMLRRMKFVMPSISYYSPYPGSALGHQLIAEGKSLMAQDNYHRYPKDEKVVGIDYAFYAELAAGKFDREIDALSATAGGGNGDIRTPHHLYLFAMKNGKKKLAYGPTPERAYEILSRRLTPEELKLVDQTRCTRIPQQKLREHVNDLN